MSNPSHNNPEMSPVKRALAEIRRLRARVEELESTRTGEGARPEPIAIIGAGLRFPGDVVDEESFWKLLVDGIDGISEIPRHRFDWRKYYDEDPDAPGTMVTRHGGFLSDVDRFDASFFGISPREAVFMDPQHRIALEVAWEALENAGHAPSKLHGSQTGVFLGIGNSDYGRAALAETERIDAYTAAGTSPAMIAGRMSYVFGLHGPSLAIDTSCSSSLVAVHLACASLWSGECTMALAGGVNLNLSPELNIALSRAHMMAPDGRCKTFDESADGYVRAEGCCIVVLKPIRAAIADADRILAVIRGSAINHDGRSGGLTAPNGPAQAAVIRKALDMAGVNPLDIGYVETHGTGTSLGDPIEVETLAAVMANGRSRGTPLAIGSVKANFGHAEAASGVAGLMKAVLALHHRTIPPSLHFNRPNPHIGWERLAVTVPSSPMEFKPLNGRRYAGVSSFGFSGTNAHLVLEEAPEIESALSVGERPRQILALSAKSSAALNVLRDRYVETLRACPPGQLANLCFTANAGRDHFAQRLAVTAESAEEMIAALSGHTETDGARQLFEGTAQEQEHEGGGICFLFTGQGSQYWGMGRELYAGSPVFREGMARCDAAWKKEGGESLIELLYGGEEGKGKLEQARYAQPALFAFEYSLAELWRSWGVEPTMVLGHSLGEYVAAVTAGLFSMEDGLRLVCARARLMDTLREPGAMRSVAASEERVRRELVGFAGQVSIAVVNGPESVVISGAAEAVSQMADKLEREGVRSRALAVTHAFHSPLLDPILDEFEECAREIEYQTPKLRLLSNLTGKAAQGREMGNAHYWREHMRSTVQFDAALKSALATGCHTFIEIGPQAHLKALAMRSDATFEDKIEVSVRRQRPEWGQMLESLAKLYVKGVAVDWDGFDRGQRRQRLALPTYPFEGERYWLPSSASEISQHVWQRATTAALLQSELAPIGIHVDAFAPAWDSLHRLTVAEIITTWRGLGVFTEAGESHDARSLAEAARIVPAHVKLMGRWMNLLADAGYLQRSGPHFVSHDPLPAIDTGAAWHEAEAALAGDPYLLAYIRNCTKHLRGVLLGRTSPLETLFPGGSEELARNLYEKTNAAVYGNLIVAAAVQAACAAAPGNRRLRVLEIGGGTGATTAAVLRGLPAEQLSSYRFTDVSEVFLQRASMRFAEYAFMRYGLLDIENQEEMARHDGSFDIIVASNVIHATRDLHAILGGVARMLAPGGSLLLLEATTNFSWQEITIGLVEGWQKSEDNVRGTNTLLETDEWIRALHDANFTEAIAVPESGSAAAVIGLHVLLGRVPMDGLPVIPRVAASDTVLETCSPAPQPDCTEDGSRGALGTLVRELPASERRSFVLDVVRHEIARVLRFSGGVLPGIRDRLMDLGVDSLMAVELRNRLETRVGLVALPATLIFDYPTPDAIAGILLEKLGEGEHMPERPATRHSAPVSLTAEEIEDLPEEEVAALLRSRLSR